MDQARPRRQGANRSVSPPRNRVDVRTPESSDAQDAGAALGAARRAAISPPSPCLQWWSPYPRSGRRGRVACARRQSLSAAQCRAEDPLSSPRSMVFARSRTLGENIYVVSSMFTVPTTNRLPGKGTLLAHRGAIRRSLVHIGQNRLPDSIPDRASAKYRSTWARFISSRSRRYGCSGSREARSKKWSTSVIIQACRPSLSGDNPFSYPNKTSGPVQSGERVLLPVAPRRTIRLCQSRDVLFPNRKGLSGAGASWLPERPQTLELNASCREP